jgi:hypothetical protein
MNLLLSALALLPVSAKETPPKLELVGEVRKIWDAGKHNAFTDLIRWHDKWWC